MQVYRLSTINPYSRWLNSPYWHKLTLNVPWGAHCGVLILVDTIGIAVVELLVPEVLFPLELLSEGQ